MRKITYKNTPYTFFSVDALNSIEASGGAKAQ
jgi:hypothetical protein